MANPVTWAFLFRSDGSDPAVDRMEMMHCGNRLLVYGTNTVEEGCEIARRIVKEEGCSLIELCGGYCPEGCQAVLEAVNHKVVVGYVAYPPTVQKMLDAQKTDG